MARRGPHFLFLGLLFVLTVSVAYGWSGARDNELIRLLPRDGEIEGWTTVGIPGVAVDSMSLYDFIDGAAVIYLEHGFVKAVFQEYEDTASVGLDLQIYDQGTPEGAWGLYHDPRIEDGDEMPLYDFGAEARVDTLGLFSLTVEFWRYNYFVRCTILRKNPKALATARKFCILVDDRMVEPNCDLIDWERREREGHTVD
jgi:hypothetical protein